MLVSVWMCSYLPTNRKTHFTTAGELQDLLAFADANAEQQQPGTGTELAVLIHQLTDLVVPLHQMTELALIIHQLTKLVISPKLKLQRLVIPLNIQLKEKTMPHYIKLIPTKLFHFSLQPLTMHGLNLTGGGGWILFQMSILNQAISLHLILSHK